MASDMGCDSDAPLHIANNLSLAVRVDDAEAAERCYAALEEDGSVQVPMSKTDFAIRYGIVQDKFGITWKIIAQRVPAPDS